MESHKQPTYTLQEYLKMCEAPDFKAEFYNGEVYMMSGSSPRHSLICNNIGANLYNLLDRKKCRSYNSDLSVFVKESNAVLHPDISVICGPVESPDHSNVLTLNPIVVFEVLSPSTAGLDRGKKFLKYEMLDSLKAYVLVEQDMCLVSVYERSEGKSWTFQAFSDLNDVIKISSLGIKLPLSGIYSEVEF